MTGRTIGRAGLLVLAVALAGCVTSDQGAGVREGVDVTRFHLGQPIARGAIRVEPVDPAQANSLEFAQTAASVAHQLGRLGWTLTPNDARSEQVALVRAEQFAREGHAPRSGVSVGVGGSTGGWRSGVGVGVGATIPVGGRRSSQIVTTELAVRIQRRSDATVAWEGRADIEARGDAPMADRRLAVERLVNALFEAFPGESGRTIRAR